MATLLYDSITHRILTMLAVPSTIEQVKEKHNYVVGSLILLSNLNCIKDGVITSEGRLLRLRLSLKGPQTRYQKENILHLLLTLIKDTRMLILTHSIAHNYILDAKLAHYIESPSTVPCFHVSDLGIRWIKEHKDILLTATNVALINLSPSLCDLLTIEELPIFLSSNQEVIRDAAKERLNKLEKGETNASS